MSATQSAAWMQRPERGSSHLLKLMTRLSLWLGRPFGRLLLHPIVLYFLLFSPAGRASSRSYLTRVLNRPARFADLYRHFHCFAAVLLDRIYLLNQRFDLFEFEIEGEELIRKAIAQGNGVFLIGAHIGSFEALRALGQKESGLQVAMAMFEENARKILAVLFAINPALKQDVISLGQIDSMLQINACLDQGTMVGMLADRSLGEDDVKPVPLLGDIAYLPTGPFRMAAIMRRPVLFMAGLHLGGNRYRLIFRPLADFSEVASGQRKKVLDQALLHYAGLLEECCRIAPYNWFNFFDFWQEPARSPT
jgi:predicted LPLAT superfamily acyltransferase